MEKLYYGVFIPAIEGGYVVTFLECPAIGTQGETLQEAYRNALDVLNIEAEEQAKKRQEMPEPASYEAVVAYASEEMKGEGVDCSREFRLQLVPVPTADATPVRINISLPRYILEDLDRKARSKGFGRSQFVAFLTQKFAS
ncbi:Uncharacterized protein family UPF0150 [Oleidesulfovibrio alaskensis G20]|jgi:predicted RNase H-like HicB family nuclease|uniref:Uncharacterized protein family UPF0150 n=1 Tax=Oleidesulfovibrio alaskensis (strain ATCC BAA-1058 / DSM 17464 / G20) TaxID=207559 RepID=Q30UU3_OLEA2|nr:type II toxin-antitoxin system HicB family antitoxin [Oleidesulfovibrio alaskensis]ABB40553.1 Uncharacterized protein family UPF0150 [Oleidesulfovibrio alaskensis G20]MBL3581002.1 type II toxin-antitoxin system HicB family antitoxin [Oleidesulfovibrio alaskensis]MBL3588036.1 type II toxin-antitoxin system HicB family antitoxin [bacterium]